jgi:hypothetical protein
MSIELQYGAVATNDAMEKPAARFVALAWEAKQVAQLDHLKGIPQPPGVYMIEGCHDAHPFPGVLYVGKTERVAGDRAIDSMRAKCFWERGGESGIYSAVWGLTLRWASVAVDEVDVRDIETLLIRAHAPAWNNQNVIGPLDVRFEDLVLLNGGDKGRLLPAVAGIYFVPGAWR